MTVDELKDASPKMAKPRVNSEGQKELDKVEGQFKEFNDNIQDLVASRSETIPKQEIEQQTKLSNREIQNSKDIYLKPRRTIRCQAKFNEKFREDYNFAKEYVQFIAENRELIGESIEIWTKRFPGVPYEEWLVPVNKPVWGPRYLAEQIKSRSYRRLTMNNMVGTGSDNTASYYGQLTVDTVVQRLDAIPVNQRKSIFMAGSGF